MSKTTFESAANSDSQPLQLPATTERSRSDLPRIPRIFSSRARASSTSPVAVTNPSRVLVAIRKVPRVGRPASVAFGRLLRREQTRSEIDHRKAPRSPRNRPSWNLRAELIHAFCISDAANIRPPSESLGEWRVLRGKGRSLSTLLDPCSQELKQRRLPWRLSKRSEIMASIGQVEALVAQRKVGDLVSRHRHRERRSSCETMGRSPCGDGRHHDHP